MNDIYKIIRKKTLSDKVKEIDVMAPDIARKGQAGQFVVVRLHEKGERIPLTIADYNREKGYLTLVFQEVGKSTRQLGGFCEGDSLAGVTGPLGHATPVENFGTVVCIGGGVGIAPIYPIARELKKAGNRIFSIIGARNHELLFWEEKMREVSDELFVCTDDGSHGEKAVVTVPLERLLEKEKIDRTWAIGPGIMMKFCSLTAQKYEAPITVSLNTIMVDGTGMCGACRVSVKGKTLFACVDGPEFNGHDIDWNLLLSRQRQYIDEEIQANEHYDHHCCS